MRWPRRLPAVVSLPSFNAALPPCCSDQTVASAPNATPATSAIPKATGRADQSPAISCRRGTPGGANPTSDLIAQ